MNEVIWAITQWLLLVYLVLAFLGGFIRAAQNNKRKPTIDDLLKDIERQNRKAKK